MTKSFSRRFFLTTALSGLAAGAQAGAPAVSLRPKARPGSLATATAPDAQFLIDQANVGGTVSYAVVDVSTGRRLEARDPAKALPPASVSKAITALYAMQTLGAGYRFRTRLIATGAIENGVIKGDLVLVGGGDPTLNTDALAGMAAKLKAAGIRSVRGKFRVFSGALPFARVIDPSQPDHVGYNPSLSGLNLNYNRVHFQWARNGSGYDVTMDARSEKYRPEVRVARISVADRAQPVYTYKDGGDHDKWTVARKALGKGGTRWLPVRRPADYAAEVFATFARSHGIRLNPAKTLNTSPKGTEIVTHRSAGLSVILKAMLKWSTNLTAELVGMTATVKRNGKVSSLNQSARAMSDWARKELGMKDARFVDHSGLGDASRISAGALAQALAKVHGDNVLGPMLKPIKMRGADGKIDRNHPLKVIAKTGTLHFVSSLAGYTTAPDGTRMAFAIFTANQASRARIDRSSDARPPGARSWNKRAKRLQQSLIERWASLYAS